MECAESRRAGCASRAWRPGARTGGKHSGQACPRAECATGLATVTMNDNAGRPCVIARGGASATAPEHTIAALEAAVVEGADAIRLEVRLTSDGQPVVFGSSRLERATDGRGPVAAHTMRDLKRLDAGSWLDPRFAGQRLQTLQEVLERFRGRSRFWVAPCPDGADPLGVEERIVSTIEIYDALDTTGIVSEEPAALARVRGLNEAVALGIFWSSGPLDPLLRGPGSPQVVWGQAGAMSAPHVDAIRRAGLRAYGETADESILLDRLVGCGVDGIVTRRLSSVRARIDRFWSG